MKRIPLETGQINISKLCKGVYTEKEKNKTPSAGGIGNLLGSTCFVPNHRASQVSL